VPSGGYTAQATAYGSISHGFSSAVLDQHPALGIDTSGVATALAAMHRLLARRPRHYVEYVAMAILTIPCHMTMASESPTHRYAREAFRLRKALKGVMLEEDEGLEGG
jgi:hypothetical protein